MFRKRNNVSVAESLLKSNLICDIRRSEFLRQFAVPEVLLSANKSKLDLQLMG